jgi:coenzyme F420 hydrogenase subunit delta
MRLIEQNTMIFGCGNLIMGDDGFGPAVIEELQRSYDLPAHITAVDAGTCVREYLFDYLLSEEGRPEMIFVLDAVDFTDRQPGEVFEIVPSEIPAKKIHDFSLHQFPTVNLLQELADNTGIRVHIIAAQIEFIPDEIAPGLSLPMTQAVTATCEKLSQILSLKAKRGDLL